MKISSVGARVQRVGEIKTLLSSKGHVIDGLDMYAVLRSDRGLENPSDLLYQEIDLQVKEYR